MKIVSINSTNNNTSFGLRSRCLVQAGKLADYWKHKGFSEQRIQKSMNIIEEYANTTTLGDFLRSVFMPGRVPRERLAKYPAIDFGDIKKDRITEVFVKDSERYSARGSATSVTEHNYTIKYDTDIPNISYQFVKNGIPMPCNKTFSTPLEYFVETQTGKIVETKDPVRVAKEIIKTFREFKKDSLPPNSFLRSDDTAPWLKEITTTRYSSSGKF